MSVRILRGKEVPLPPIESEDGLTAKAIMDKIRSFYRRFERVDSSQEEWIESYFLDLLYNYPQSMCNRHMTPELKQVMNLLYFESKPEPEKDEHGNIKKVKDVDMGLSFDDLAMMFDVSKATVHEVIRQGKKEAKELLEIPKLKMEAKRKMRHAIVEEEMRKFYKKQQEERRKPTKQTNEPVSE